MAYSSPDLLLFCSLFSQFSLTRPSPRQDAGLSVPWPGPEECMLGLRLEEWEIVLFTMPSLCLCTGCLGYGKLLDQGKMGGEPARNRQRISPRATSRLQIKCAHRLWGCKSRGGSLFCFAFLSKPQGYFLALHPGNDRQGQGCRVPRKRLPSPEDHHC